MAKLKGSRKWKSTKEAGNWGVFEEGEYLAQITASKKVPNSNKNGEVLKLVFSIIDGKHKGRKVYQNLNTKNPNQQAEDIAWGVLKTICIACGLKDYPEDTKEFHDIPFMLDVGIEPEKTVGKGKRKKTYKARNKALGFFSVSDKLFKKGKKGKKGKNGKKGKKGKKAWE